MKYTFKQRPTALGVSFQFEGPGMSPYISVHPMQIMNEWATHTVDSHKRDTGEEWYMHDAFNVVKMLTLAYEAGREAKAKEFRAVLGVPSVSSLSHVGHF